MTSHSTEIEMVRSHKGVLYFVFISKKCASALKVVDSSTDGGIEKYFLRFLNTQKHKFFVSTVPMDRSMIL